MKQRWTEGAVVKIPIDDNRCAFGILLKRLAVEVKRWISSSSQEVPNIVELEELFRVSVYGSTVVSGHWQKVGKVELSREQKQERHGFVQDRISGELFLYHGDFAEQNYMRSCSISDVAGLECVAVYEADHVAIRISSEMNGDDNPLDKGVDVGAYEKFMISRSS